MIKLQFRVHNGKTLNLKDPKSYTEKLQWYKLNYRDPIMTTCVDKYSVKEYVAQKLNSTDCIIPTIGHWLKADEIDFNMLPNKCVLKTTNGSGTNIFFDRDKTRNYEAIRQQLDVWLNQVNKSAGREWAYDNVKPSIICEPVLEATDQAGKGLDDYKFFCFNGHVAMKWVDYDRFVDHKRVLFDAQGNRLNVSCTYPNPESFEYPEEAFRVLQPIAEKLAEGFPHARIDLYYTSHKPYFGEITFYSGSGYELFNPDKYDYELGRYFVLPSKE
ncbi:MAG: hypothetical protein KA807_14010 [Prolixibacteraceae bacterium]|nr:hypothetical protein [Prolixibacteraceae bacterium]